MERDDEKYDRFEKIVGDVMERYDYDSLERDVEEELFLDVHSLYSIKEEFEENSEDWVVVDNMLEKAADKAKQLYSIKYD